MQLEALTIPIRIDKAALLGAGAAITAFIGLATLAVNTTFKWADELDKIGDVTGATIKEAAAYAYVARVAGVSSDTFSKAQVLLYKSLLTSKGGLDITGKALKNYGINVKNVNGTVKTNSQLTSEIAKKYSELGTAQERINFLTEVYGKSGAELIDFFDTLAQQGGIDAVTQKVEALGLAIDPGRYEQFNRNLEELKLIGLALAVSFTEKLMPVIEGMMEWGTEFAKADIPTKFRMIKDALNNIDLVGLTENFKEWVDSVDWDGISQKIITGIRNIDWASAGEVVRESFKNIFSGLSIVVSEVDWAGIFSAADYAFMDFLAGLTGQGSFENVIATWTANFEAMALTFRLVVENLKGWWSGMIGDFIAKIVGLKNSIIGKAVEFITAGKELATKLKKGFTEKVEEMISSAVNFIMRLKQSITEAWKNFSLSLHISWPSIPSWLRKYLGGGGLGGSTHPNGYASGGSFTVPPGYPNDSYPVMVQSGEHVSVTPAGQSSVVELSDESLDRLERRLIRAYTQVNLKVA